MRASEGHAGGGWETIIQFVVTDFIHSTFVPDEVGNKQLVFAP